MKTLLLSVGRPFFRGALWGAYDFELPLNVAYVASFLSKNFIPVDVVDFQIYKNPIKKLKSINFNEYRIIGINSDLGSTYSAYQLAKLIKEKYQILIFAFGVYTVLKEIIFEECNYIDFVIHGEEEHSVLKLVTSIASGHNPESRTILQSEYETNLDIFPFPSRDKFELKRYFPSPGKYYVLPQFPILSSRGCNWRCFFCSNLRGKGIRFRSAENIVEEIDELQSKYKAREINFVDDNLTADRERVLKFIELMRKRKNKIYIRACSRIDTVDKEVLKGLKEIGLYSIGYGIESGVDEILKFNNKGITTNQIEKTLRLTQELGLEKRGFFMLNLPGDNRLTTEETLKFIKKLKLDLVNVQITYPWPGTEMREFVKNNYKINETLWNNWEACDGDDVLFLQSDLTTNYILNTYKKIIREHYLNPKFIFRWLKRLKSFHDLKYSFLQFITLVLRTIHPVRESYFVDI
ncbi:MAG: B12-binding domain-containing radical SAM protein [Candidatus Hydrogenedentota bacterium]